MSLLMQALKKAERARQSGLHEEDLADGRDALPDAVPDGLTQGLPAGHPGDTPATPATPDGAAAPRARPAGGLELSLEPIEEYAAPPARVEPPPPPAPIEPAVEAAHNPVPPQARHEGTRGRAAADEVPVTDARPAPRPAGGEPPRRPPGAPERRATPRAAPAQADNASGLDTARLRIAGLSGLLVVVVATFGYLYWQAVTGPGPGASLPMVPMPPPSATGATTATNATAAGDAGIVVAPAGPPFGPLDTGTATAPAAQAQPEAVTSATPAAPPAAATPSIAAAPAVPAAAPATRAPRIATIPTAEQLAAIADPVTRAEAEREAVERAARMQAMSGQPAASLPAADPGSAAAPASSMSSMSAAPSGDVQVTRSTPAPTINPGVRAGYAALNAGDLAAARQQYAAALRDDASNRDALLGSAAVALREGRDDEAAGYYARLLAANPRDAEAIAGLTALRPGGGDRAEIRLRGLLRDNPEAAPVHFALGNLYARQGRWQEAQQAYFRAWTAAPGNADYAFNLAVGLDRLNQGRLAREYYQRALALAAGGPAAFDRAAVQRRLLELGSVAAPALPARAQPAAPALPAAGN
jgi:tetratricopeptide (TPR) repeat protein